MMKSGPSRPATCVVALFNSNDLRLHDNYMLTMAARRAQALGVPLVSLYCYDMRCFAQPSLLCGFYRASPLRATFLTECLADLRGNLRRHKSELLVRTGLPEVEIPQVVEALGPSEVYCTTQYAPHEDLVQRHIAAALHRAGSELKAVWGSTLYHIDDLPHLPESIKEHFKMFFDDVDVIQVRPTQPYNCADGRLAPLGIPTAVADETVASGSLPTLGELGYSNLVAFHPTEPPDVGFSGGETSALERLDQWLTMDNLLGYVTPGSRNPNRRHTDSVRQARLSPWISTGCLSPRYFLERLKQFDYDHATSGVTSNPVREANFRLARRDYCHFMGLKWGRKLFFPYGPRPEDTEDIPDARIDRAIVQKWAAGLTGVPFVDAGMKEMSQTGWASQVVRETCAWMLARGFGQDWRVAAEWFERSCLDYDPFVTYYGAAYFSGIIKDRFDQPPRPGLYNAYRADALGIYVRRWLPQLSRIPNTYIHRPHVISEKMQRMYNVYLGTNYPLPLKLWRGAQREFDSLPAYFAGSSRVTEPGLFEAERFSTSLMKRADVHPCMTVEGQAAAAITAPTPRKEEMVLIHRKARDTPRLQFIEGQA